MADISHKLNKPNLQLWGSWENIHNMQEIIFFAAIKIMIKNLDVNFKIWEYVVSQNSWGDTQHENLKNTYLEQWFSSLAAIGITWGD